MKTIKWKEAQKQLPERLVTYLWFGTTWCGDCQMMLPIVENVEKYYVGYPEVQFIKVDAEEAGLFRQSDSLYQVLRVPTHVFLKQGRIRKILYEYLPEEALITEINYLLKNG